MQYKHWITLCLQYDTKGEFNVVNRYTCLDCAVIRVSIKLGSKSDADYCKECLILLFPSPLRHMTIARTSSSLLYPNTIR